MVVLPVKQKQDKLWTPQRLRFSHSIPVPIPPSPVPRPPSRVPRPPSPVPRPPSPVPRPPSTVPRPPSPVPRPPSPVPRPSSSDVCPELRRDEKPNNRGARQRGRRSDAEAPTARGPQMKLVHASLVSACRG